jgi:hypothetical protein
MRTTTVIPDSWSGRIRPVHIRADRVPARKLNIGDTVVGRGTILKMWIGPFKDAEELSPNPRKYVHLTYRPTAEALEMDPKARGQRDAFDPSSMVERVR